MGLAEAVKAQREETAEAMRADREAWLAPQVDTEPEESAA